MRKSLERLALFIGVDAEGKKIAAAQASPACCPFTDDSGCLRTSGSALRSAERRLTRIHQLQTGGALHYVPPVRVAFKEWAVVVDALGRGDQIIILRKGGISEGPGGFQLEHNRFCLFPTLFHQQRESVQPTAQIRYDALAPKLSPNSVHLQFFAEVADWKFLDSLEAALRLRGQHIWREEVIRDRFDWGKSKSIYAMAVRVFRLPMPVELPMRTDYGGCKSWVELDTIVSTEDAQPVLTAREFNDKLQSFHAALEREVIA